MRKNFYSPKFLIGMPGRHYISECGAFLFSEKLYRNCFPVLILLICIIPASISQSISITAFGPAYSENFNTLATTGTTNSQFPTGWTLTETGGGARDNEQYGADNGGSATGDTYSYGATSSSDRAFGGLQSGTLIPVIGVLYTNNTGGVIQSLTITYTGEQWRMGTVSRVDRMDFQYSIDAMNLASGTWIDYDALDFTAPVTTGTVGLLDGNLAANRTLITSTITGLNIPNGSTFWFRWNDLNATSSDDGLAVDDFSLTACCAPLLVRFLNFNVEKNGAYSKLNWSTTEEFNNDYFEIQRSGDGVLFKSIGNVDGFGNTAVLQSYQFMDIAPMNGINYYRLKQYDEDGSFDYSPVQQLVFSDKSFTVIVSPNPAADFINVEIQAEVDFSELRLIDLTGRTVLIEKITNNDGGAHLKIDNLDPGTYMIVIESGSEIYIERIVVVE